MKRILALLVGLLAGIGAHANTFDFYNHNIGSNPGALLGILTADGDLNNVGVVELLLQGRSISSYPDYLRHSLADKRAALSSNLSAQGGNLKFLEEILFERSKNYSGLVNAKFSDKLAQLLGGTVPAMPATPNPAVPPTLPESGYPAEPVATSVPQPRPAVQPTGAVRSALLQEIQQGRSLRAQPAQSTPRSPEPAVPAMPNPAVPATPKPALPQAFLQEIQQISGRAQTAASPAQSTRRSPVSVEVPHPAEPVATSVPQPRPAVQRALLQEIQQGRGLRAQTEAIDQKSPAQSTPRSPVAVEVPHPVVTPPAEVASSAQVLLNKFGADLNPQQKAKLLAASEADLAPFVYVSGIRPYESVKDSLEKFLLYKRLPEHKALALEPVPVYEQQPLLTAPFGLRSAIMSDIIGYDRGGLRRTKESGMNDKQIAKLGGLGDNAKLILRRVGNKLEPADIDVMKELPDEFLGEVIKRVPKFDSKDADILHHELVDFEIFKVKTRAEIESLKGSMFASLVAQRLADRVYLEPEEVFEEE